jgi:hypothetical protein
MKTRKFEKKLALNKNTVANLNTGDMRWIRGGKVELASGESCPVCALTPRCETWDCPITSTVTYYTCQPCPEPDNPD